METIEKMELVRRARQRNASLWINMDWGGVMAPLAAEQETLNRLGQNTVENYLAISDDLWGLKEEQRDRESELDQAEITQARQLADDKVALGRAKLAIQMATDEYLLAVQIYDAKVKALLQGAREYAAQVELEQLAVERSRAELAVEKEELRLKEINAKVYYEVIQRAQVEVDLARAQVDVAKAHVRVAMSEIEAGRAEIDLIEAQVQQAMAVAEKATLQADVATIFAEILTKKLAEIKLDVEQKEIAAGFEFIQSKLADMLAIWDSRMLTEQIREEAEKTILEEVNLTAEVQKAEEALRLAEAEKDREVFEYEETQTDQNLNAERALRQRLVAAKKALADARKLHTISQRDKTTWAEALINNARAGTYKNQIKQISSSEVRTEYISGE